MAVLDWLQQLLGGGDPEASGAAAASTAMQPMTQPFVNLGRDLTNTLAVQPVTDAFGVFDRVLSGQGFTPVSTHCTRLPSAVCTSSGVNVQWPQRSTYACRSKLLAPARRTVSA